MRISRSESPAPVPSLDYLPPMENSWALEAEREACLHGEDEILQSEKVLGQRHGSCFWTPSKRLHVGGELFCRPRVEEDVLTSNRVHENGKPAASGYNDSSSKRHKQGRKNTIQGFTSASRCYPPSIQAPHKDWFPRGTEAVNKGAHTIKTWKKCGTNRNRISGSKMHLNQSDRSELACKTLDHSLSGQDSMSEHGIQHSQRLSFRRSRARCSYGNKISLRSNWENEISLYHYKPVTRKHYGDATSYNDASRKQYDNGTTNNDALGNRHDNATAYNAVNSSTSKGDSLNGPYTFDSKRRKGWQDQEVGKEHHIMMASSLFSESENFDVNSDLTGPNIKMHDKNISKVPAILDINVHTETSGIICPAKTCDKSKKRSRRQNAQTTSIMTASSELNSSPAVFVDVTNKFELCTAPGMKEDAQETDSHRLSQRQRQIEYGKNTLGYERYIELVPRLKRKARDPQTPNPKQLCSKRSWDGQIRKWRRLLHVYDPPCEDGEEIAEDLSVLKLQQAHTEDTITGETAASTLSQWFCEPDGNTNSNNFEEKMVMEDASMAIYDDWMEF